MRYFSQRCGNILLFVWISNFSITFIINILLLMVMTYCNGQTATTQTPTLYPTQPLQVDLSQTIVGLDYGSATTYRGYSGDNGLAIAGKINSPYGLFVDSARNLYIVEKWNHIVRKISYPSSIITTVAGTGTQSRLAGDNGQATAAFLYGPTSVWISTNGVMYIADAENHRIRKVTVDGIITTFAGMGTKACSSATTYTCGASGSATDNVNPTATYLLRPQGIGGDSLGNIFLSDTENQRVRKVNITTNIITTIAGPSGLNCPLGMYVISDGTVYFADAYSHRVRKVSPMGIVTTVAGTGEMLFSGDGGPATSATLNLPATVWITTTGIVYFAELGNHRVRKISPETNIITSVAGTKYRGLWGKSGFGNLGTRALIGPPLSVRYCNITNSLYFVDTMNKLIHKLSLLTNIVTIFAGGGASMQNNVAATSTSIATPNSVMVDTMGNVYYAEAYHVRKIDFTTGIVTTIAGTGTTGFNGDSIAATLATIDYPCSIYMETTGLLYFSDVNNKRIRMINTLGIITTVCGTGTGGTPVDGAAATSSNIQEILGLTGDRTGKLYFAEFSKHKIRVINLDGTISTYAGTGTWGYSSSQEGGPATSAMIASPQGLWIDSNGNMYFTEVYGNRVRKISAGNKAITLIAGLASGDYGLEGDGGPATAAKLMDPRDVTTDLKGNIYIADSLNHRIRKLSPQINLLTTIAGSGIAGRSGDFTDNTLCVETSLASPYGVAVDANGDFYFTEWNRAVRKCVTMYPTSQPSSQPSTQPSRQPSSQPTSQPTTQPSRQPSIQPTLQPTTQPSSQPLSKPTSQPTTQPSFSPSTQPSTSPSRQPSIQPSSLPSRQPYARPTAQPTAQPTFNPSSQPSNQPTRPPSQQPVGHPTVQPSQQPFSRPSTQPSSQPSQQPILNPSGQPSKQPVLTPTCQPSTQPVGLPTSKPTQQPTVSPSKQPSSHPSCQPTYQPIPSPSAQPSRQPSRHPSSQPSNQPSRSPTNQPSSKPSLQPTCQPSKQPSATPSRKPTSQPTNLPSTQPSTQPTKQPTIQPTTKPSTQPSQVPTVQPSGKPSQQPSANPTMQPSTTPTVQPLSLPSAAPTGQPSKQPTASPTGFPSTRPSISPSNQPSGHPSRQPTRQPISHPTSQPTDQPSHRPSTQPTVSPTNQPSTQPSSQPSNQPTSVPSSSPSTQPTANPSNMPSSLPTTTPTSSPTIDAKKCPLSTYYTPQHNSCTQCPPNSIQLSRGAVTCTCQAGYWQQGFGESLQCTQCQAGYFSKTGDSACTLCPSGYSSLAGSSKCSICKAGTFSTGGASECTPCSAGTFTSSQEQSSCNPCELGSYASKEGTSHCQLCEQGSYADTTGSSRCQACGASQITPGPGATSSNFCVNPGPNFAIGGATLVFAVILIYAYLTKGRLQRLAFERKVLYVYPLAKTCYKIQKQLSEELNKPHQRVHSNVLRWSPVSRTLLFLLIAIPLMGIVVSTQYIFVFYKAFYNAMFMFRGLAAYIIVPPFIEIAQRVVMDLAASLRIPSKVIGILFYPAFVLIQAVSSLSINLDNISVTCEGAKAPAELTLNFMILGVVMSILLSGYQYLWLIIFPNLMFALLKRSLLSYESTHEAGATFSLTNTILSLLGVTMMAWNPFEALLRYLLTQVKLQKFFLTNGGHAITPSCDEVVLMFGIRNADTVLGVTSTLLIWWLIMPLVHILSEILVPRAVIRSATEVIRLPHEELRLIRKAKKPPKRRRIAPQLNVETNWHNLYRRSNQAPERNHHQQTKLSNSQLKQIKQQANLHNIFAILYRYWLKLFQTVQMMISIDIVIISLAKRWLEFLGLQHGFPHIKNLNNNESSDDESSGDDSEAAQNTESMNITINASNRHGMKKSNTTNQEKQINFKYLADRIKSSVLLLETQHHMKVSEKRITDAKEEEERFRATRLSSYSELCLLVTLELHHQHHYNKLFAMILSWLGPGQFLTRIGTMHWRLVLRKYYHFICGCLGIWTDEMVDAFAFEDLTSSLYISESLAEGNEHDTYRAILYISIGMRSIVLQIIPILAVVSVVITMFSSSPLFVRSEKLMRKLPHLIVRNSWELALQTHVMSGQQGTESDHNGQWMLWLESICTVLTRSRLFTFTTSFLTLCIPLLTLSYNENTKSLLIVVMVALCPFICARLLPIVILIGKQLQMRDSDFVYTFECVLWLLSMGRYQPKTVVRSTESVHPLPEQQQQQQQSIIHDCDHQPSIHQSSTLSHVNSCGSTSNGYVSTNSSEATITISSGGISATNKEPMVGRSDDEEWDLSPDEESIKEELKDEDDDEDDDEDEYQLSSSNTSDNDDIDSNDVEY